VMNTASPIWGLAGPSRIAETSTTDGTIALLNLEAQIEARQSAAALCHSQVENQVTLVELIALRGLILGRVADYERAAQIAEQLAGDASAGRAVFLARARTRANFHLFMDALDDLEAAQRLSLDAETASAERAAIFQALGRYDEALAIREEAANRRPNFETLAALAGLWAERGDAETAQRLYRDCRSRYRGVSPFPLALLDFQMGLMWMEHGQFDNARTWFDAARRRLPAYAAAQCHLAEVEAELGEIEAAATRLYPLAASSDDPDNAAQLARILGDAGRTEESYGWRQLAAARYDELVERHPEAFSDHAAEFWLAAGADPDKAVRLAQMNLDVRKTQRAHDLLSRAVSAKKAASGKGPDMRGARTI
jgi:tetratricopeptide (TPR) repeat protein